MLMKQYLREDFHFTPYNTICYLVRGERSRMLEVTNKFEITLIKNSNRKQVKTETVDKNEPRFKMENDGIANTNSKIPPPKEITIDDDSDELEGEKNVICLDFGENDSDNDFKPKAKKLKNN